MKPVPAAGPTYTTSSTGPSALNPLNWPTILQDYTSRALLFLVGSILFVLGFMALLEQPAVEVITGEKGGSEE